MKKQNLKRNWENQSDPKCMGPKAIMEPKII